MTSERLDDEARSTAPATGVSEAPPPRESQAPSEPVPHAEDESEDESTPAAKLACSEGESVAGDGAKADASDDEVADGVEQDADEAPAKAFDGEDAERTDREPDAEPENKAAAGKADVPQPPAPVGKTVKLKPPTRPAAGGQKADAEPEKKTAAKKAVPTRPAPAGKTVEAKPEAASESSEQDDGPLIVDEDDPDVQPLEASSERSDAGPSVLARVMEELQAAGEEIEATAEALRKARDDKGALDETLKGVRAELQKVTSESSKAKRQLVRTAAAFANFRKRSRRDI
ncbi:MAG: hypothetical protein OXT09_15520 [Myxococcales bacterium]|nr:hypothetical protein [Myxococcales bacterium]